MKKPFILKLTAFLLAAVMIFSLSGCGNSEETNTSDPEDVEYVYVDGNGNEIAPPTNSSKDENANSSEDKKEDSSKDESESSSKNENSNSSEDKKEDSSKGESGSSSKNENSNSSEDKKDDSSKDENTNSSKNESTDSSKEEKKVVNNCYTSGTKIAEKPITLTIMACDYNAGATNFNNCSFTKYIKEKTNITLKFETCVQSDVIEKMTLAYASGKMPDMFWGMAPATTFHNPYIKKGQVKEIGGLIEKYAPNIQKMYKENPSAKYITTFDDGKTYMIPMVDSRDKYGHRLFINRTWLSNLKLSVPKTTDELYNVLKKFKSEDANGNGNKNDEIPMMVSGEIDPSLFGPWGTNAYFNGFSIDQSTDKVYYVYTSEAYRNGLRYFNKLFKEKLLDENLIGTKPADIYSRTSASVQTVGVFSAENYGAYVSQESLMKNYVVLPLLKASGSQPQYYYNTYENNWNEWCVITSSCKYAECAVRLVDSLYSLEGTMLAMYGAPGSDGIWNYDSNGKIVFNFNKKPSKYKSLSDWTKSRTPAYGLPHYSSKEFYNLVNNATAEQDAGAKYLQAQEKSIYSKVEKNKSIPKLYYTDSQVKAKAKVGDIGALRYNMFWEFLSGTSSLDNDWDSYVSQMNRLGVKDLLSIEQAAYNSYRAWLKKNG